MSGYISYRSRSGIVEYVKPMKHRIRKRKQRLPKFAISTISAVVKEHLVIERPWRLQPF